MKKSQEVSIASPEYRQFIEQLKARVLSARLSAARAVNRDVILLYWDIGRDIVEKQRTLGWGDSVVEMVSADLRQAFPGSFGFSPQNVWRMLQFFRTHTDNLFLSQVVREMEKKGQKTPSPEQLSQLVIELIAAVPWGHHANVLAKLTDPAARLYYLRATAQFGWSRNVLLNQIKAGSYERAVTEKKTHNFPLALPEDLAEQAEEMMKSSYNLEFLGIRREMKEQELEDRLISRLQAFILELGYGFCFVGRRHRLALRGNGMADAFREHLQSPACDPLSFAERFGLLVDRQWDWKENARMQRYLRAARLKLPACIEDIDFRTPRGIDRAVPMGLASCDWVRHHRNVLVTGPTGVGKTFIACALAHKACREGHRALYIRCPRLFQQLALSRADGSYGKLLARIAKVHVLLIDDLGLAPMSDSDRRDLLEIIEDRHGGASTIVTSQLPLELWHDNVGDPTLADAILDRLVHNAHRIELKGASMRKTKQA